MKITVEEIMNIIENRLEISASEYDILKKDLEKFKKLLDL